MDRVLHIVMAMNRGGLESFIMNIYRNIDRNKIQFDFIVHTDKECDYDQEILKLGGKIYRVPSRRNGIIRNRQALNSFFNEYDEYSVVHQHVSSLSYIEPIKAAKRSGIKTRIIHSHSSKQNGSYINKYLHYINRLFIDKIATHYFTCSDLAAKWLYGKRRFKKEEYKIINNGIDLNRFIYDYQIRTDYRTKFDLNNKFVVGHVGRFAHPKNHEFLIDIFKAIYDKEPNSVLLLVGNGELRGKIEEKSKNMGLRDSIIFTGVRHDVNNLLQAMDVFVFPSHYEGLPVSLVEAQAAGLLCFTSSTITKQVNLTNLIKNIDITYPADYWADCILTTSRNNNRDNIPSDFSIKDFDVYQVVEELTKFYQESLKEL